MGEGVLPCWSRARTRSWGLLAAGGHGGVDELVLAARESPAAPTLQAHLRGREQGCPGWGYIAGRQLRTSATLGTADLVLYPGLW